MRLRLAALLALTTSCVQTPGGKDRSVWPDSASSPDSTDAETGAGGDEDGDGWSVQDGDCDDEDPSVSPGATERCSTAWDDDCDADADELDAEDCIVYYVDADGDGYGSDASSQCMCEPDDTWSCLNADDCDDADAAVNPIGFPCRFEGPYSTADASTTLLGESAGDLAGNTVAFVGDLNGVGRDNIAVGAWTNDRGATDSGVVYLVSDPANGDVPLAASMALIVGECPICYLGVDVAGVGDADGDGYADIVIGESGVTYGDTFTAGVALLFQGPLSGALSAGDDEALRLTGLEGMTGQAVAAAGDMDEDGIGDLLIGQPGATRTGTNSGAAWICSGGDLGEVELEAATGLLEGESTSDYAGWALDGGRDVNGDGVEDLLIGAWGNDEAADNAGAAYLILGPTTGSASLADADLKLLGEATGDLAGRGVAQVMDVDGDGMHDMVIGAREEGESGAGEGAAYLVALGTTGVQSLSTATAKWSGVEYGARAGLSVATAGDLDLDGHGDVLIGAPASSGNVYLAYGPVTGTTELSEVDATWASAATEGLGTDVAGGGDVDGDGLTDILMGAIWNDGAAADAGAAYLYRGDSP